VTLNNAVELRRLSDLGVAPDRPSQNCARGPPYGPNLARPTSTWSSGSMIILLLNRPVFRSAPNKVSHSDSCWSGRPTPAPSRSCGLVLTEEASNHCPPRRRRTLFAPPDYWVPSPSSLIRLSDRVRRKPHAQPPTNPPPPHARVVAISGTVRGTSDDTTHDGCVVEFRPGLSVAAACRWPC